MITAPPEKSISDKWNDLPNAAKIGIYAGAAGFVGLLAIAAMIYCIRQRRRGAREARAAEARAEAERLELERFKKAGVDPDSFVTSASEYNAKEMRRDGMTDQDSYSVPNSPSLQAVSAASPLENNKWDANAAAALGVGVGAGAAAGAGAASAMRSPVPLLSDGAQSPRVGSPGFYSDRQGNSRSPAPSTRQHTQSPGPGMRSPTQGFSQLPQPHRSYTSPNAQMRMGSPGPQQGFGDAMQRSGSPAQLAHPQPQRSFTTDGGYGDGHGQAHGGGYGVQGHEMQDQGYGSGGRGDQGYWGNAGGYR